MYTFYESGFLCSPEGERIRLVFGEGGQPVWKEWAPHPFLGDDIPIARFATLPAEDLMVSVWETWGEVSLGQTDQEELLAALQRAGGQLL